MSDRVARGARRTSHLHMRLEPALLAHVRAEAARANVTVTAVVCFALAAWLAERAPRSTVPVAGRDDEPR